MHVLQLTRRDLVSTHALPSAVRGPSWANFRGWEWGRRVHEVTSPSPGCWAVRHSLLSMFRPPAPSSVHGASWAPLWALWALEALTQPPVLPASLCTPSAPSGHQPQIPTSALLPSKSISLRYKSSTPFRTEFQCHLCHEAHPDCPQLRKKTGPGRGERDGCLLNACARHVIYSHAIL